MCSVSVIVPLHNSKKYLRECIESILHQTEKDIEIICVDSSTDGTTEMMRQYQKGDSRIRLVEDANASYGYKLNMGMRLAEGEYMAIVESDDYIAKNMMEELYRTAKGVGADFVKADFERYIDTRNGRLFGMANRMKDEDYNRIINLREETRLMPLVGINIWSGIYRLQFLKDKRIRFNESEGASYQDTSFAALVTLLSERAYFLKECYYKYRGDNNASSVKSEKKYKCIVDEFIWLRERMNELGCISEVDSAFFKTIRLFSFYWNYSRLSEEYRDKFVALDYVRESAADFDEKILGYEIPNKETMLKVLDGDIQAREEEKQRQMQCAKECCEALRIFHEHKSIVIVCAGVYGLSAYRLMKASECDGEVFICDNVIRGKRAEFDGREVFGVEEAARKNKDSYFIVANKKHGETLKEQLLELGVDAKRIYLYGKYFASNDVGVIYDVVKGYEKRERRFYAE